MTRAEAYWILEEIRKESFSADYVAALGIAQETIEFVDLMPKDMVPVVHGEWISHEGYDECNLCHNKSIYGHNYCPNCGARMDGE